MDDHQGSVHGAYSSGVMAAENCQRHLLQKQGHMESLPLVPSVRHEIFETTIPPQISRIWLCTLPCSWKWEQCSKEWVAD